VLGIKETPLNELLTDSVNGRPRIQLMFSHTAKGQSYNMPLLARFKQSTARLIDYELMTDPHGKRVVAFGWYAGAAGVPEAFSALALDHLKLGVSSPFLVSHASLPCFPLENSISPEYIASAPALSSSRSGRPTPVVEEYRQDHLRTWHPQRDRPVHSCSHRKWQCVSRCPQPTRGASPQAHTG
jgi:hypothetical protein